MAPGILLLIYCGAILLASLAGGGLPAVLRLTHSRMQIALSFVAGVMLGIGLLHLLPHAYYQLRSIDATVSWALGGFLLMFFLERFFHFHHHDAPDELAAVLGLEPHAHDQGAAMLQPEAASIVVPRERTYGDVQRSSPGQSNLATVCVPTERQVESLAVEIQQIRGSMHQHDACPLGSGKSRAGVGLAGQKVVESANPDMLERRR